MGAAGSGGVSAASHFSCGRLHLVIKHPAALGRPMKPFKNPLPNYGGFVHSFGPRDSLQMFNLRMLKVDAQ